MNAEARMPDLGLNELQQRFGAALHPDQSADEVEHAYRAIGGAAKVDAQARLKVYRANVIGGQINAARAAYPACERILGEQSLRAMLRDYLIRWPSTKPDLNDYGGHLPELLSEICQSHPDFANYPYLPDLAQLEWALHALYYAADDEPFDWSCIAALSPQQQLDIRPIPSQSVRLIRSAYPIDMLHKGTEFTATAQDDGRRNLIVFRDNYRPQYELIEAETFALIQACADGFSLGEMAESGTDSAALPELIQRGWVSHTRF